ncbi:MAG: rhodanese-like domain-containing protein [Vicingaceae bacterium]
MNILSIFGVKSKKQEKIASFLENNALIVDVRSKGEFNSGHAPFSVNVPLDSVKHKVAKLKSTKRPLILVCRSGARSGAAATLLSSEGIECVNGGSWNNFA